MIAENLKKRLFINEEHHNSSNANANHMEIVSKVFVFFKSNINNNYNIADLFVCP